MRASGFDKRFLEISIEQILGVEAGGFEWPR